MDGLFGGYKDKNGVERKNAYIDFLQAHPGKTKAELIKLYQKSKDSKRTKKFGPKTQQQLTVKELRQYAKSRGIKLSRNGVPLKKAELQRELIDIGQAVINVPEDEKASATPAAEPEAEQAPEAPTPEAPPAV
jgi:hypothetical protein